MRIDLGSVTAYSIAVKNGFTGTESEWMQAILNAGENAQDAAESAQEASESAMSAENSAISAEESAEKAKIQFGSPLVAHLVADMEDENRVYVYVGEETGYIAGNWYYYDGSEWTSGGSYNAEGVNTDPSLSIEDMPADAKAVGDAIENATNDLEQELSSFALNYKYTPTWEQGYIRSDGTIGDDPKSCTTNYIGGTGGKIIVTMGNGYRSKIAIYDSSKNFINILFASSADDKVFTVKPTEYARIQVSSDSNLYPSIITDSVILIEEQKFTDVNPVKTSGKPADAKEVSDLLSGIVNIPFENFSVTRGYYAKDTGSIGEDIRYAKTEKFTNFSGETIRVKLDQDYKYAIRMWDDNDSFVDSASSGYLTENTYFIPKGWTVAFNFENNSVTNLSSADYVSISQKFHIYTINNSVFKEMVVADGTDFNDIRETGTYRVPSGHVGMFDNVPTNDYGRLVVFSSYDKYSIIQLYSSYKNILYTRFLQVRDSDTWTPWSQIFNEVSGGIGEYIHDGLILQMEANPESIPVNENHLGYNDFISTTWESLLPTNYVEGDPYDADTTKIINVQVSRESDWQSTPYGDNQDVYTIYRYIFTPINGYKKTVFLSAGCHGNEAEGYWGLYRLMRMIYFDTYKYPTLRNLRDNVRFIIVPSWNPWGMQHYRRYNAFESNSLQAWKWLYTEGNQIDVNGVVYDISDVGEAGVIWDTLQDYGDSLNLWMDMHTDPYAGRTTSQGEIDDPRGYTPPYGFYGFARDNTTIAARLQAIMEDFYYILKNEYNFNERWHLVKTYADPTGAGGFTPWMASLSFPTALVEVSTFMEDFPYVSGSQGMMKLAQEYYGCCLSEFIR